MFSMKLKWRLDMGVFHRLLWTTITTRFRQAARLECDAYSNPVINCKSSRIERQE